MKPINLSFAACGFLGIYHLGAASALCTHGRKLLKDVKVFAGASAGSLVATVLLTAPGKIEECNEFTYKFAEETRRQPFGAATPGYDFMARLRSGMESILPHNAHELAQNRLHVSITNTKTGENYLVSHFSSREDLIKVLLASSFVPVYAGLRPVEYKGQYVCESWTMNKDQRRVDAFELWCWQRILNIPWTARRMNKPVLKVQPECFLEARMGHHAWELTLRHLTEQRQHVIHLYLYLYDRYELESTEQRRVCFIFYISICLYLYFSIYSHTHVYIYGALVVRWLSTWLLSKRRKKKKPLEKDLVVWSHKDDSVENPMGQSRKSYVT
ncbi:patatin-like phospholipase domain-containing protein 4 isoform X2 [Elephas maximus indicus]|uniref:patatin-like phospholipase domain-containing protein 4 isoform X2 n=1 Tax=Elephas maximus indicus TaxID=99487 RepID=UPI002115F288|nr:patatin-like phospholipase domain-containing protein 4 isoform X2 [Elephas maximus indicus]